MTETNRQSNQSNKSYEEMLHQRMLREEKNQARQPARAAKEDQELARHKREVESRQKADDDFVDNMTSRYDEPEKSQFARLPSEPHARREALYGPQSMPNKPQGGDQGAPTQWENKRDQGSSLEQAGDNQKTSNDEKSQATELNSERQREKEKTQKEDTEKGEKKDGLLDTIAGARNFSFSSYITNKVLTYMAGAVLTFLPSEFIASVVKLLKVLKKAKDKGGSNVILMTIVVIIDGLSWAAATLTTISILLYPVAILIKLFAFILNSILWIMMSSKEDAELSKA